MPRLVVNHGTPEAWEVRLKPGINTLGRDIQNDVPLDHESVASCHCRVVIDGDFATVENLDSAAGTFIDQAPVQEAALQPGQTLRVGDVEMRFETDAPARLTGGTAAKPGEPPIPPPVPTTLAAFCKNHRQTVARHQCGQCQTPYCDICVSTRSGPDGVGRRFCLRCGGECFKLTVAPTALQERSPKFLEGMAGAFNYPFQEDGWILMTAGTVFYLLFGFFGRMRGVGMFAPFASLLLMIFGTGYLCAYMVRIISSSAQGDKAMPDWPDFTEWTDVTGPLFQVIGTLAISFLPWGLARIGIASGWVGEDFENITDTAARFLGYLYLPMGLLAVAMFDNLAAVNPLLVVPSIGRVWKEYGLACGLLMGIELLVRFIQFALLLSVASPGVVMRPSFASILFSGLISGFIWLYFLIVEMRILGMLYRTKKAELGWFSR